MNRINAFSLLLCLAVAVPIVGCSQMKKAQEPVEGGSCRDMENYFNQNFGRSDTKFSNYEGQIGKHYFISLGAGFRQGTMPSCKGGVVIQSLPTGKKTCSAEIFYDPSTKKMNWEVNNTSTDCFVSE